MKETLPGWVDGITAKRPEVCLILHALVISGIRKGYVTAEDAHNIPVSHPNVRGAAMKHIGKFGFAKDEPIKGTTGPSHGHWLYRWKLIDHLRAKEFLDIIQKRVVKIAPSGQTEMNL